MKTISRTLFILLLACAWSCSNDDDSIVNNDDDANSGDPDPMEVVSSRLSSYTIEDVEFEFTYDESDGKLTRFQYGTTFTVNASIDYDDADRISEIGPTTYQYDAEGRLIRKQKGDISIAEFTYDSTGKIIVINSQYPNSSGGANSNESTISYNSAGLPERIETYDAREDIGFPQWWRINLGYDGSGNLIEEFVEISNDGTTYTAFETWNYSYDDKKNPFHQAIGTTGVDPMLHAHEFIQLFSVSYNDQGELGTLYFTSPNNLLTITSSLNITTFEYIYNEDDYPETLNYNFDATSSGGGTSVRNYSFNYEDY